MTPNRVNPITRPLKILWLSHFVPFPPKGGCFQRNYNLIKRLGVRLELHLIAMRHKSATHPASELAPTRAELERCCRSVEIVDIASATQGLGLVRRAAAGLATARPFNVSVYTSAVMRAAIRAARARTRFDVIHFDTIGLAQYLDLASGAATVVTHHGAEAFMIRRRIPNEPSLFRKAFFLVEWTRLRRYEARMCGRFDANVVMSDDEGRILGAQAPNARFVTVPNGVDVNYFRPVQHRGRRTIVFAGRLDQYSNRFGVLQFMKQVWPRIVQRYPDATIHLVGGNPPDRLAMIAAADARVTVHGFVPDVRPYFEQATVAICPVLDGGGTRLKVLDALAQGTPLVSTTIGCEGIAVVPERHLLIGDTPEELAHQIGRTFDDPALCARLAAEGRRLVETRYSWDAPAEQLIDLYDEVARDTRTAKSA